MLCFVSKSLHDLFIIFFYLDVKEIRGIGLQVSKLESVDSFKQGIYVLHRMGVRGGSIKYC